MKFIIRKIIWKYNTNIEGKKINLVNLYVIELKRPFYKFFKKRKYLRISPTSSGQYIVKFTNDINHTTKFKVKETAEERIKDIFKNPNKYEIE